MLPTINISTESSMDTYMNNAFDQETNLGNALDKETKRSNALNQENNYRQCARLRNKDGQRYQSKSILNLKMR